MIKHCSGQVRCGHAGKQGLEPVRSEVSWAQSLTLRELLALGTHLGKGEASQALDLLGPTSPCSLEQQGAQSTPRGERENWQTFPSNFPVAGGFLGGLGLMLLWALSPMGAGLGRGLWVIGAWQLPSKPHAPQGPFPGGPLTPQPLFPVLSLRDLCPPRPGPRLLSRGHQRLWGPREAWRKPRGSGASGPDCQALAFPALLEGGASPGP